MQQANSRDKTDAAPMQEILNRPEYPELMKERALGRLPEMGSAIRMAQIIGDLVRADAQTELSLLDVGCAAGHYLQSIAARVGGVATFSYVGVDADPMMVEAAKSAWTERSALFPNVEAKFVQAPVEGITALSLDPVDIVYCSNAFMYFRRPKAALENMLGAARRHCIIRSYFHTQTFIIKRAQTVDSHPVSDVSEAEILDENGEPTQFDNWNIYGHRLIEDMASSIDPAWRVRWEEDRNVTSSIVQEKTAGIEKYDGTTLWNNQEVVYPFILPWKYAIMTRHR